jgi:hypothetical protein
MDIMAILGVAGSVSLLAGWRLYLSIFATGLAMRLEVVPLPEHLRSLEVLADPWVLSIAGIAALVEFFADKVMWLDSVWDAVHTFIRPVGGALLALALIDPSDPATQVIAFLLGGGATLASHVSKAGTRAMVNTSPEPVSNIVVSSAEDVATAGLLYTAYEYPQVAAAIAALLAIVVAGLLVAARSILRRLFGSTNPTAGAILSRQRLPLKMP